MRIISSAQVQLDVLATLGLSGSLHGLSSREVIASAIRRAASFICPCSARSLISAITKPLHYMVEDGDNFQTTVENVLEEIIAIGDLQEYRNVAFNRTALLYLAPPSYVCLSGSTIVLLGIKPDNVFLLPEDIQRNIVYKGCLRYLKKDPPCAKIDSRVSVQNVNEETNENLVSSLSQLGLLRYSEEDWLNAPPDETASQYINRFERSLDRIALCGDISGITILNTEKSVRYYRGRWSSPKNMSGRYIGRRPQAYGNDIWCYLEVKGGQPKNFLDLPLTSSSGLRGCDEAWRIQAALDAQCGKPQQYRLRKMTGEIFAVDVFSPIPSWIERRWNWVGKRIENKGSLLSFQFEEPDIKQELDFVRRKLWLVESTE